MLKILCKATMVKLNVGALAQGLWTQLTIHAYRNSPGFVIEFDDDTKKKKKKTSMHSGRDLNL